MFWSSKGSDKVCREKPIALCSTQCVLNFLSFELCTWYAHTRICKLLAQCILK